MILNRHEIETAPIGTKVRALRAFHRGAVYRRVGPGSCWQAIVRPTGDTPAHVDCSRDLYAMSVELVTET